MSHHDAFIPVSPHGFPEPPSLQDLELLARLEEQNRLIESATKSAALCSTPLSAVNGNGHLDCNGSLRYERTHSRQNSQTSFSNHSSNGSENASANSTNGGSQEQQTWGQFISEWDVYQKKKVHIVKDAIRADGIPPAFRSVAWQLLTGAINSPLHARYEELLQCTSPFEKAIRRDIARTYPSHEYFKDQVGQESLFNVIKAYSIYDREVGYCQGSGFVAGLLLTVMPEMDAFCVLTKLMQDYGLREMFKPNMAQLGLCMFQLECLVQDLLPDLNVHFQSHSVWTSTYASSWFLTLFSTTLPMSLSCWIMDLYISEGMDVIFKIALGILQYSRMQLLAMDMEHMLHYFQKELPKVFDQHAREILRTSYDIKLNTKKMKKLEKEYLALKTREQEDAIELRRLRTENNLLRQRVQLLEQESADLADRLIRGQVERAKEAEERYVVRRQLCTARGQCQEALDKLKSANETIVHLQTQLALRAGDARMLTMESAKDELIAALQRELIEIKSAKQHSLVVDAAAASSISLPSSSSSNIMPNDAVLSDPNRASIVLAENNNNNCSNNLFSSRAAAAHDCSTTALPPFAESLNKLHAAPISNGSVVRSDEVNNNSNNTALLQQIRRQQDLLRQHESQLEELTRQNKLLSDEHGECMQKREELTLLAQEEKAILLLRQTEQEQQIAELNEKLAELEIKVAEMNAFGQIKLQSAAFARDLSSPITDQVHANIELNVVAKNGPVSDRIEQRSVVESPPSSIEARINNLSNESA